MARSAKKSINIKLEATDELGLRYFTIYEVKGVMEGDERIVIGRYTDRAKAEGCQKLYYDAEIYKTVYIMEQTVWVD